MANFYKKLYTPLKETLEDDYPNSDPKLVSDGLNRIGTKLTHNFKTANGLKLKTTVNRNPNGDVIATTEPELKNDNLNVTLSGKLGTDRKYEVSLAKTDLLQKGTKLYVKGLLDQSKPSFEGGFEYKDKTVAADGKATYTDTGDIKLYLSGVIHNSGWSLGGEVERIGEGFSRWSAKVQRDRDDGTFCFFSNNELIPKKKDDEPKIDIGFGYHHQLRNDLKGGVDFKVNQDTHSEFRFGCDYKVDESSNLKSKVTMKQKTEMRLGLLYKKKVTPYSKFIASADLNVNQLAGNDNNNNHIFSLSLSYGDD